MNEKTIYLAYGSNLNRSQMAGRCPTAKYIGAAALKDYRLLFRGKCGSALAAIEPEKGSAVLVGLWEITPADEISLDRYAGFPHLYKKETVKVKFGKKTVAAMVYIMNVDYPLNTPSRFYFGVITAGYKDCGLSLNPLNKALGDSVSGKTEQ